MNFNILYKYISTYYRLFYNNIVLIRWKVVQCVYDYLKGWGRSGGKKSVKEEKLNFSTIICLKKHFWRVEVSFYVHYPV